jgi:hypothetical protein
MNEPTPEEIREAKIRDMVRLMEPELMAGVLIRVVAEATAQQVPVMLRSTVSEVVSMKLEEHRGALEEMMARHHAQIARDNLTNEEIDAYTRVYSDPMTKSVLRRIDEMMKKHQPMFMQEMSDFLDSTGVKEELNSRVSAMGGLSFLGP